MGRMTGIGWETSEFGSPAGGSPGGSLPQEGWLCIGYDVAGFGGVYGVWFGGNGWGASGMMWRAAPAMMRERKMNAPISWKDRKYGIAAIDPQLPSASEQRPEAWLTVASIIMDDHASPVRQAKRRRAEEPKSPKF